MINFQNIEFLKSVVDIKDAPITSFPEVVFVGRSNVGKSSLINAILGRKIANVSKIPGRTASLNYYLLDKKYYLVDSPGYGYSKNDRQNTLKFAKMMEPYFKSQPIKIVIFLLDSRRKLNLEDVEFNSYLRNELNLNVLIVFTKYDKLNMKEKSFLNKQIKEQFKNANFVFSELGDESKIKMIREYIAKYLTNT